MQERAEFIDLGEICYLRYWNYNSEFTEANCSVRLRGGVEVDFGGDCAIHVYEQYMKYKKRKSVVSHITEIEGE